MDENNQTVITQTAATSRKNLHQTRRQNLIITRVLQHGLDVSAASFAALHSRLERIALANVAQRVTGLLVSVS
jgi:hypothetical protein